MAPQGHLLAQKEGDTLVAAQKKAAEGIQHHSESSQANYSCKETKT